MRIRGLASRLTTGEDEDAPKTIIFCDFQEAGVLDIYQNEAVRGVSEHQPDAVCVLCSSVV